MFVGETGIGRIVQRSAELTRAGGQSADIRKQGAIDLPTIQKYLNLWYSLSLDLFGSEVSTNAANFYNAGLKGRFHETRIDDDHRLTSATYPVAKMVDGAIKLVDEPALTALNMRLRDAYTDDCAKGIERWNKIIEKTGVTFRLALPHTAFHRQIGEFRNVRATPGGTLLTDAAFAQQRDAYLPSIADGDFIASLMQPVSEPGRFAGWIAPPKLGIDNRPGDFEYVKIEAA